MTGDGYPSAYICQSSLRGTLKLVNYTAYTSLIQTFKKQTKDLETGILPSSKEVMHWI